MNLIYLKSEDMHLDLDRIERVCHDAATPIVVPEGEGTMVANKVVTVVYLITTRKERSFYIYDSDDRALLRERLEAIAKDGNDTGVLPVPRRVATRLVAIE